MILPKVSIVIPTYNNGYELRRALQSVMVQDAIQNLLCTVEIIIVNDSSDEEYLMLLNSLVSEFPLCTIIHTCKKSGPAAARNLGLQYVTGELIGFLDADDEWPEDKLSNLIPYFISDDIEVAGGKIRYIVEEGNEVNMNFEDQDSRITHVHLGALLVRKNVFERGITFDSSLSFSEDVDWWFRLREQEVGIVIIEATTLLYYVHGSNMSVNKSLHDLQMLRVFHQSIQRRQAVKNNPYLPQIRDFRIGQEDPLISIIIPLYNGKHLISETLKGVISQTYTHWELIVVDDGSEDGGADFVEQHFPQVNLIRQSNAGVAAARNKGIQHAKNGLIAFLDQDDEWLPTKLREQWEVLKNNPYCAFVTCNQCFICHEGVTLPANFSEKLMEEHRSFVPSAVLIRKPALLGVNLFDESLEVSSDFDLIRKLRKAGYKEKNAEKLLLKKWYHGNNASQNKPLLRNEILGLLHRQIKGK